GRRRERDASRVRDAFETWRSRPYVLRVIARCATILLALLGAADLVADSFPLRQASWIAAVLVAGVAALLAAAAAESSAVDNARRWHLQAAACLLVMFMLMSNGTERAPGDALWFLIVAGAASTLVAMATSYRDKSPSRVGAVCLALDSAIVGFTVAL